jgi:fumarylacetoacetate (FAA) hydrolase
VILDDVPMGVSEAEAGQHIKLVTIINDVSLRNVIPGELGKGFGFYQGKPASAFAPVAITPDALGDAWDGGKLLGPMHCRINGEAYGHPDCGLDMNFEFPRLIAHAARTRNLEAGTVIGSGTISNRDRAVGSSCIAEKRMIETIEEGAPKSEFLKFGDSVRIEFKTRNGQSPFGAIDQVVQKAA